MYDGLHLGVQEILDLCRQAEELGPVAVEEDLAAADELVAWWHSITFAPDGEHRSAEEIQALLEAEGLKL